jgi:hypothetical protein
MAGNFFACAYCGQLFGSDRARCDHEHRCSDNPDNQLLERDPATWTTFTRPKL